MYFSQDTAERIKTLAKEKKIQIKDMLFECGLNKNSLSTMQTRGSWLQSDSLAKIADYLDCSIDYLMGRTDIPKGIASDDLSEHEKELIAAYRNKPAMQDSIDKLLDIPRSAPKSEIERIARTVVEKVERGEINPANARIAAYGGYITPKSNAENEYIAEAERLLKQKTKPKD